MCFWVILRLFCIHILLFRKAKGLMTERHIQYPNIKKWLMGTNKSGKYCRLICIILMPCIVVLGQVIFKLGIHYLISTIIMFNLKWRIDDYHGGLDPGMKALEKDYWDIVEMCHRETSVEYANDLDVLNFRSGFPVLFCYSLCSTMLYEFAHFPIYFCLMCMCLVDSGRGKTLLLSLVSRTISQWELNHLLYKARAYLTTKATIAELGGILICFLTCMLPSWNIWRPISLVLIYLGST